MLSLLIETCTERGVIAFLKGIEPIYVKELPYGYQNSQHLLPEIQKAFQAAGLQPKQLEFISVGIGPGSYTGIRVGVVVAKALAYALKIPLVGVCSLEGFLPSHVEEICYAAVIDAKIGGLYWQMARLVEGNVQLISSPQVCQLNEAQALLSQASLLISPNIKVIKEKMEKHSSPLWHWEEKSPDPIQLTRSALKKIENGKASLNSQLDLLYLRKTQAEMERGK